MGFIEDVQEFLRQGVTPEAQPLPGEVDLEACRDRMWASLEKTAEEQQKAAHEFWSRKGMLEAFVGTVFSELRRGVGARWSSERLQRMVELVIDGEVRQLSVNARRAGGVIVGMELDRVGALARRAAADAALGDVGGGSLLGWCQAVRLVDTHRRRTQIGDILQDLVGRDALQFALELECALSSGAGDDRRISAEDLHYIIDNEFEIRVVTHSWSAGKFTRLESMGLIYFRRLDESVSVYSLMDGAASDLLRTVVDPAPNPVRSLVTALLDVERGKVATTATGQPPPIAPDFAYVRMIVHELRNATLPMVGALRRLWTELERPGAPDLVAIAAHRERVDQSVQRLQDFIAESERLATAAAPEAFSLRGVIDEAIGVSAPDRNGRILVELGEHLDQEIEGARGRWVLLFVNLLRNAAQVRKGKGKVWIHAQPSASDVLHVYVDDDGPGVPEELRERVFQLGVSTRGGTGLGLHEARITVLLSSGSIVCEDAPQGGARFHIQVHARRRA